MSFAESIETSRAVWSLPTAKRAIIVAGCLSMAYTQLTMSPATIEFARSLGAGGLAIGVLGALPAGMLFMQFVAATCANHMRFRRRTWFLVSLIQRLACLPVAVGPFLFPQVPDAVWIWCLVAVTALNHALIHFATPLWLSWMGDYLPHDGLSRFWGVRHLWMQWTAAASLLAGAVFLLESGWSVKPAFGALIVAGAVFGVLDILLFFKVDEPPVQPAAELKLSAVFSAPLRHREFRSFIGYACFWHFAAMVGAPFISLYLLAEVGMDLFHVLLLWACSWVGGAVLSAKIGKLAEEFGNRALLVLATVFKCTNMVALLLVPTDPTVAFWVLVPVFMLDAVLNAAIAIATNGFMLKNSPAENRTMYIASGTALAGIVGGVTSIAAGGALQLMSGWSTSISGVVLNGYHVLFAVSLLLRLATVPFVLRVREAAGRPMHAVQQLIGATPLRFLRFPLGFYRWMTVGEPRAEAAPGPTEISRQTQPEPALGAVSDQ